MEWPPAEAATEAASFQRDLDMYRQWSNRSAAPSRAAESPFPDRCAILLDPAMMEQARRAEPDFEVDVTHAAGRMLGRLGRGTAAPMRKSPRKARIRTKAKIKKKYTQASKNKTIFSEKKRSRVAPRSHSRSESRPR